MFQLDKELHSSFNDTLSTAVVVVIFFFGVGDNVDGELIELNALLFNCQIE